MARLNPDQAKAAAHPSGHAIVLAGPGTGKTSTLAGRHAFLRSRGVDPTRVIVVTFTQRAAEEIRNRLGAAVTGQAWIGTFHGIAARFLKRFHAEAGLPKSFKILDPAAQRQLLVDIGVRWDADDGDLTDIIGRWKDSMRSPAGAAADVSGGPVPMRLAAEHYAAYEAELARRGDVDFADLVTRAIALVRSNPVVSEFVSSRFTSVLVDEFQDVNRAQVEMLTALVGRGLTIWAVADDDQALYGWRGGDVRLTVNFADRFPGATSYTLRSNYRCAPAVLAAALALIGHNKTRVRKDLVATKPHERGAVVRVRTFPTETEEAAWISSEAARIIATGVPPRQVCVLFRTAAVAPAIQQAMEAAGVPFSLSGATNFWASPEVGAVVELLAAVEEGNEKTPMAARSRGARDLISTMKGSPPAESAPAVGRVVAGAPPAGASAERAALWADSAENAASIAAAHPSASAFAAHVAEMSAKGTTDSADAVSLSTIHSSKGLEWRHVFVAGFESSLMPHHRSEDPEEERRLAYVALTRSKAAVDVTMARERFDRAQSPSPFLAEMSTAPTGAVVWPGGGAPTERRGAGTPERPAAGAPQQGQPAGPGPKTFRKRGGRSLVSPDEE